MNISSDNIVYNDNKSIIPTWLDCLRVWRSFVVKEKAILLLVIAIMSCVWLIPALMVGNQLAILESLKQNPALVEELEQLKDNPEVVSKLKGLINNPVTIRELKRLSDNPDAAKEFESFRLNNALLQRFLHLKDNPDAIKLFAYFAYNTGAVMDFEQLKDNPDMLQTFKNIESNKDFKEFTTHIDKVRLFLHFKNNPDAIEVLKIIHDSRQGGAGVMKWLGFLKYDPDTVKELLTARVAAANQKGIIGIISILDVFMTLFLMWAVMVMFLRDPHKYLNISFSKKSAISASISSLSVWTFFKWFGRTCTFLVGKPPTNALKIQVLFIGMLLLLPRWGVGRFFVSHTPEMVKVIFNEGVVNYESIEVKMFLASIVVFVFIWLCLVFMLTSPIQVLKKDATFKDCYRIIKGYKGKIFYNYLIIMSIFIVGAFVAFSVTDMLDVERSIIQIISVISCSVIGMLALVAVSIYSCMVYRAIMANKAEKLN